MDIFSCASQYCVSKLKLKEIKNMRKYYKLQAYMQSKAAIAQSFD